MPVGRLLSGRVSALKHALPLVLLFLAALLPRVAAPGHFLTVDEIYHWFDRVERFLRFVQQGDYARTNIIGHPGVTTMWLGAFGRMAHQSLVDLGWVAHADADPYRYWWFLRAPVGIVAALCVPMAYLLLRRLCDRRVALLAALLWAGEPFLVAHAQLLHLDALVTSFINLSLLAALAAFHLGHEPAAGGARVSWALLAGSGVAGGLAFLTKSPSIILFPMVGLIVLVGVLRQSGGRAAMLGGVFPRIVVMVVLWGGVAALVWVALWPAAWVDLGGAIERVFVQARDDGGSPHGWGNFFMGRAVDDPGPLFYPVVLVLRMAPWTMVGIVLAGVARYPRPGGDYEHRGPALTLLLLFALLFLVMMTIPPKKFDRYVLPVFPILNIVAAYGWVWAAETGWRWFSRRGGAQHRSPASGRWRAGAWALVVVILAANLVWYHPYELAFYNPLVGGGKTAVRAIPVGWGEGYEQAGAFISAQPNGCDRAVASWFAPVLSRFLCNHWVVSLDRVFEPGKVDYAVLYIDQVQRGNKPAATAYLQERAARIHTVTMHGIPYAAVYQLPLPNAHRLQADFGPAIRLLGYDVDTTAVRASGTLSVTLQWIPRGPIAQDYHMFLHVFDAEGEPVAQVDVPPGGPRAPTSAWVRHSYVTWIHPVPLPPDLPPGSYWITLGLYDPSTFERLPLSQGDVPPGAPDDGAGALVLKPILLE